jgi:hypothetical protein
MSMITRTAYMTNQSMMAFFSVVSLFSGISVLPARSRLYIAGAEAAMSAALLGPMSLL